MAGGRLGFGVANSELINDINTLRYSTNPYNVNRLTATAGIAVLESDEYYLDNCEKIVKTREMTFDGLKNLGLQVLDSKANFLFAKSPKICGLDLYLELRERGFLVRHFNKDRIKDFIRITIGTDADMTAFLSAVKDILKEK
jgi:histidinol-phosphate aminotransferase